VPGFREIGLGLFEGLTAAEAQKKYPLQWAKRGRDIYNVAPPEGESYAQLSARVLSALDASLAPLGLDTNVAIVAHRAVIQVIMASQAGLPPEQAPTIPIQYGQLVKVKRK
jgi:probable phosphoglycerate mutase